MENLLTISPAPRKRPPYEQSPKKKTQSQNQIRRQQPSRSKTTLFIKPKRSKESHKAELRALDVPPWASGVVEAWMGGEKTSSVAPTTTTPDRREATPLKESLEETKESILPPQPSPKVVASTFTYGGQTFTIGNSGSVDSTFTTATPNKAELLVGSIATTAPISEIQDKPLLDATLVSPRTLLANENFSPASPLSSPMSATPHLSGNGAKFEKRSLRTCYRPDTAPRGGRKASKLRLVELVRNLKKIHQVQVEQQADLKNLISSAPDHQELHHEAPAEADADKENPLVAVARGLGLQVPEVVGADALSPLEEPATSVDEVVVQRVTGDQQTASSQLIGELHHHRDPDPSRGAKLDQSNSKKLARSKPKKLALTSPISPNKPKFSLKRMPSHSERTFLRPTVKRSPSNSDTFSSTTPLNSLQSSFAPMHNRNRASPKKASPLPPGEEQARQRAMAEDRARARVRIAQRREQEKLMSLTQQSSRYDVLAVAKKAKETEKKERLRMRTEIHLINMLHEIYFLHQFELWMVELGQRRASEAVGGCSAEESDSGESGTDEEVAPNAHTI